MYDFANMSDYTLLEALRGFEEALRILDGRTTTQLVLRQLSREKHRALLEAVGRRLRDPIELAE